MGVCGVSGRGHRSSSFVDKAGWRCPEGDASSRWLIDIRTDLFPPDDHDRGDPHAQPGESDPLAELARLIGQTDPFGAAANPSRRIRCSRARNRPQIPPSSMSRRKRLTTRSAGPAAMDAARAAGSPPPPPAAGIRCTSRTTSRAPVHPLASLSRPSSRSRPAAASQRTIDEPPQYAEAEPQPDPSRYDDALYGQIESGEQRLSARSGLSGRSLRLSGRLRAKSPTPKKRSQRADDGGRGAGAGGGRHGRRPLPIAPMSVRPAAASRRSSRPTTARPRWCRRRRARRQDARTA